MNLDEPWLRIGWMIFQPSYARSPGLHYAYESPQGPYSATLKMSGSGFVAVYPDLWEMED
jgi:hypothetical protein